MNRTGWAVAMFVAAQTVGAAKLEITLQVYNAARAPKAELRKALDEASWILGQAGIETHWLDCGDSVRDGAELPGCEPCEKIGFQGGPDNPGQRQSGPTIAPQGAPAARSSPIALQPRKS